MRTGQHPDVRRAPLYRPIIDQAVVGVWTVDATGATDFVNPYLAQLLGYTPEEMLGRRFTEFVRPASVAWAEARFEERKDGTPERAGICELVAKDGRLIPARYSAGPLRDDDGRVIGSASFVSELEGELDAAAGLVELRHSEIETLYGSAPLGLCVVNRSLQFTRANLRLADIDGVPPADHLGRTVREVMPHGAARFEQALRSVFETGEPLRAFDLSVPRSSGVRVWRIEGSPIRDRTGTVLGIAVAIDDVTDARQVEASLRRFAHVVDNATDFIGMCDLEFRPFYVNAAGAKAISLGEHRDASVFDFFFPEDHAFLRTEFFPQVLRDGRASIDIRFKHFKTGAPVWMRYAVVRMDDADGRPIGYATISQDLSDRRHAEERLAHKRHILEMMASGAPLKQTLEAIVRLLETHWPDAVPSIMLVDDAGGLRVGAAPGLDPVQIAALEGLSIGPAAGSCGTAAFRREPVIVSDIEHDPLWADYRHLALPFGLRACWSVPILASTGRVVGTIAVYYRDRRVPHPGETDLASDTAASLASIAIERHLKEQELHEQARALMAADRNKDEFLAKLAHELRNPLGAIQVALEILGLKLDPDSPLHRSRAVIDRQTKHIVRLIDDLSDLSRIASGKIELRRQPVDVVAIAADAVDTVRSAAVSRTQQLDAELPDDPIYVEGDPARLMQVFVNLLNNAVKYTQLGGRIHVAVTAAGGDVSIKVRDNGLGIAGEMLPKVFDLYAQAEGTREQAQGGVGIGLHLAQSLVRLHGGTIWATSPGIGQGSEFEVRLPINAVT